MAKKKTANYFRLHSIYTEDINRENTLIQLIIHGDIDDVIAELGESIERIDEINKTIDVVNNYIKKYSENVIKIASNFHGSLDVPADRKEYFMKYGKDKHYNISLRYIYGKDLIEEIKTLVLKDTFHLMKAKEWLIENAI